MISAKQLANSGMHAGWPSTASLDLRPCTTHPVHIGCRATQITDDSLVPFQLFQLLDFAEDALFAPGRNRSSLVLGDGAKGATAKTTSHDVDGKFDRFIRRDLLLTVDRMRSLGVRE